MAHDFSAGVLHWCFAESVGELSYACGIVRNLPKVKGQKAVNALPGQQGAFVICLDGDEIRSFLSKTAPWDVCILPVEVNSLVSNSTRWTPAKALRWRLCCAALWPATRDFRYFVLLAEWSQGLSGIDNFRRLFALLVKSVRRATRMARRGSDGAC